MPRLVVQRGDRFGARARGTSRWLGTFDTRDEALEAIERAACSRPQRAASRTRRVVKPPSEPQIVAMAAAAPEWLRGMILVAAYTGLRLFEVAALRPSDLIAPAGNDGWMVRVRRGKGGFEDEMSVVFEPALGVLLEAQQLDPERLIFLTAVGTPVDRRLVSKRFRPIADEVGFPGTFHALRHWHATWLIDMGKSDLDVSVQLRHHDSGELVRRRYGRHFARQQALRRIASDV